MKRILSFLLLTTTLMVMSCFEPPQYSNTPEIKFLSVRTVDVASPTVADTVEVRIGFKDGDGDLGVSGTDFTPPFNPRWYYLINPIPTCEPTVPTPCKKASFVDVNNLTNVVKFSTRRTNPDYDTLPTPYSCTNYQILRNSANAIVDTVYIQRNIRTNTFFCDLYTKEAGVFVKYNLNDCSFPYGPFYGRFDVLGKDGNPDLGLPVEGELKFAARSNTIFTSLKNKTLQLRIRIIDRAGNLSNEVISREFTLN
jgi:hypothetical protein